MQVGCKNTTIPADSSIVTSIGKYAFRYCGSISKLHIPANITSITQGFSIGCRYITITVDSANPVFEEIDGALVNTQTKTLVYLPMTASLPESAKIENIANYSLSGTRTIHITKYIKTYNGIQEDNKLSAITCSSENEYLYATNNCLIEKSTGKLLKTSNSNFKVPDGVKSIQSNCFYANTYTSPIIIPSSCTTISSTSFNYSNSSSGDEKLKIYIPSTCANISAEAFTNTNVEIYTDVASASAKPSGWNSKMIASTSSAVWHYGTTLSQFKTLTGYTD